MRKILFRATAIVLSISVLLLIELGLRLFNYGGSMRLFVDHNLEHYEDYYIINPFVGLKYFQQFQATEAINDIFLKHKPDNGFRIFVLGSSTTFGFPYEPNLMASRILHKRLQDAFPDRTVEVVNTSITAINSVTLKDFARQIRKYEPNALLIYAGHNEFYGAYGIGSNESITKSPLLRALHFRLLNLRLYQLLQSTIQGMGERIAGDAGESDQKGTLMKRIVKDQEIISDSENYAYGINQFRDHLSDILDGANKDGIPVFLSDLVSNVKDIPPFGDTGTGSQSASYNYQAAQSALAEGDTILARKLFYAAKDLDPVRFRASEEVNQVIYALAEEKGALLIRAMERFSEASPGGIIGDNLLTEHVHPNIEGQFLLADAFYQGIIQSGVIKEEEDPLTWKSPEYYRRNWGYTDLDSMIGEFKVRQLKSYWPYQPLDREVRFRDTYQPEGMVENYAFQVITDPDASVESIHYELGQYFENNSAFIRALEEYMALAHINPYWSEYLNTAAYSLFHLNDLYRAEKYLRESLKYTPTYTAFSMLGEIEFIKNDYSSARTLFEKAYALLDQEDLSMESSVFLLSRLFYIYRIFNDPENVQKISEELQALGQTPQVPVQDHPFEYSSYIPYNIQAEFNKAVECSGSDIDSAKYYLDRCLMVNDCPVVNLYIGDILYQMQDLDALHYYLKAYDAYAQAPDFLTRLFYAYFVNVNSTKAGETLNRLKRIDPANSQIPRLETLLNALQ